MRQLNLPEYSFRFRQRNDKTQVFDIIRKKYIVLTPEEWVRQNFVAWLIHEKKFPTGLIGIEKEITLNGLKKRYDIVIYNLNHRPEMLIECKAPDIAVSQKVFDQIAIYNMVMHVKYLIVTNGLEHFCCTMDFEKQKYFFLDDIPEYTQLFGNR
ncbi:MAG TPA: type I restriction enzyme HsdR N-terminal domain-containing protein [Bacteroidales bacterium]|nr:type I restriction enzyme HsdR N-terminal domain-containing protein [Bacteroidales bacterium]HPS15645.1 type I restriction enzyme HsdR N-terminal domain-containing protein [Bacteroidales bacterium]